jgi:hypothetical protein
MNRASYPEGFGAGMAIDAGVDNEATAGDRHLPRPPATYLSRRTGALNHADLAAVHKGLRVTIRRSKGDQEEKEAVVAVHCTGTIPARSPPPMPG